MVPHSTFHSTEIQAHQDSSMCFTQPLLVKFGVLNASLYWLNPHCAEIIGVLDKVKSSRAHLAAKLQSRSQSAQTLTLERLSCRKEEKMQEIDVFHSGPDTVNKRKITSNGYLNDETLLNMVMQCSRQVVSSRHPDVRVSFVPLGCGQGHQHHHQPSGRGTELLPRRSLYRRRSPPDTAAVPQVDPSLPADAR